MRAIQTSIFLLFGLLQTVYGQFSNHLNLGFESNLIWYNDDSKIGDFYDDVSRSGEEHLRSNNYLKLDYNFYDFLSASVQVESYSPQALLNFSPNFENTNIGTYNVRYKRGKIDVTAGYYYAQFGSGLILRSWEDRELGLNNALRGGMITYKPLNNLSITALYGKHRVGFKTSNGSIFGADFTFNLSNQLGWENTQLNLGGSYVGRQEKLELENPGFDELTNAYSGRFDLTLGSFYAGLEYVMKNKDGIPFRNSFDNYFVKPGSALLFNSGFTGDGFGADLTMRRLENMTFFSDRLKKGNIYNENVVNFVPALTKQQDFSLANIYVYQPQFNVLFLAENLVKVGEIGGQLDVFYKFKKDTPLGGAYGTSVALNTSYWAGLKTTSVFPNPDAGITADYDTEPFGFGTKYFSDFNLEIRKKWNSAWFTNTFFMTQNYNKRYLEDSAIELVRAKIVAMDAIYKMSNGKSAKIEIQHLWTKEDKKNWAGGTLEYNFSPRLSFYANDIYNYGNDHEEKRIHYFNFGGSISKGSNRLSINYGRQRGGLLCVGGVCRVVSESTGLTANLTINF